MSRGPIIDTGLVDALRGGMQGGISLASLLSHIEDQKRQAEMEHQRLLMDQAWRQSQESIQKDRNAIDREQLAETARGHDLQALDREADNKRAEGVIKDRQQQYQEKRTDQTNANRSTLAMAGVQPTTTAMMPFGGAGTGLPTMPMPVQQDNPEYQQGLMADPQILAQQMKDQIEEVRRQSKVAKGVNLLNRAHQNKMPAYMVAMRDDMGNPVPLDTYLAGLGHPLEPEDVNPHAREAYIRGVEMMGPTAYDVMGSGKAPPAAVMKDPNAGQMTPTDFETAVRRHMVNNPRATRAQAEAYVGGATGYGQGGKRTMTLDSNNSQRSEESAQRARDAAALTAQAMRLDGLIAAAKAEGRAVVHDGKGSMSVGYAEELAANLKAKATETKAGVAANAGPTTGQPRANTGQPKASANPKDESKARFRAQNGRDPDPSNPTDVAAMKVIYRSVTSGG